LRRKPSKKLRKSNLFEATFDDAKEGVLMPRPVRDANDDAVLKQDRAEHFIHVAVVAAILVEPKGVAEWLDVPDDELGRRFKNRLWKAAGIATSCNVDLPSLREEGEALRRRDKRPSKRRTDVRQDSSEDAERYALIQQGKMLSSADYCRAAGITEKKLQKHLVAQRLFTVGIGGDRYVPSLFLSGLFERKAFTKVLHRLERLSDWQKYLFFTTALESQGGTTPLQLLMAGSRKQVLNAADEVVSQRRLGRPDAIEFMSTTEAAKLLFVSRRHVVKLIDQGKLKIHHKTGNALYVMTASVLAYQTAQQKAATAYRASSAGEE
jgi:excisionase family DNA binding protein